MIDDSTKDDIRKRTDLVELCQALGLDPKGKVARCPAHNDQGRPNLHIYPDNVHCFACNWGGDAFELVAKVKGCDFPTAFDFLAARLGLPLIGDLRKKGRGLGNKTGGEGAKPYPKPSPLPSTPSPTLATRSSGELATAGHQVETVADQGDGLGNTAGGDPSTAYPKPPAADQVSTPPPLPSDWPPDDYTGPAIWRCNDFDQVVTLTGFAGVANGDRYFYSSEGQGGLPAAQLLPPAAAATSSSTTTPAGGELKPPLPPSMWQSFDDFVVAWAYWQSCKGYRRALGREGDRYVVGAAVGDQVVEPAVENRRPSLRVEVFAALLAQGVKASATAAGYWMHKEKGITPATLDRFGLVFLDDPTAAAGELRDRFGLDTLRQFGIVMDAQDKKTGEKKPFFSFSRHRLLFPFYWKGEPVDVQGRDIEATDKQSRFRNTGGKNAIPYNADALLDAKAKGSPVFLCEGATDTLSLAQSGRAAVGIVGTGGFKPAWLEAFKGLDVFLAFDGDDAGRKAAKNVTKTFIDGGLPAPKTIKLPTNVKDVTEFFRSKAQ